MPTNAEISQYLKKMESHDPKYRDAKIFYENTPYIVCPHCQSKTPMSPRSVGKCSPCTNCYNMVNVQE